MGENSAVLRQEVVQRIQYPDESLTVTRRDSRREERGSKEHAKHAMQYEGEDDESAEQVVRKWIENLVCETDVEANAREDSCEEIWSWSESRLQIEEKRAPEEDEYGKDGRGASLDVLRSVDVRGYCRVIDVRPSELREENA